MKLTCFILLFLSSYFCFSQKKNTCSIKYDTLVEKNNPSKLNFEVHQLFIDTTANSNHHKRLKKYTKSTNRKSNYWVVIRKLDNEFLLYNRSDGMDPILEINSETLIFKGIHETSKFQIRRIKVDEKKTTITVVENSLNIKAITIEKTNYSKVSKLSFYKENIVFKYWATKIEDIIPLNCLVNTYKYGRVEEFNNFIEPE